MRYVRRIGLAILTGMVMLLLVGTGSEALIIAQEVAVANGGLDERLEAIGYNSLRGEFLIVWRVDVGGGDTDLWGRRAHLANGFNWKGNPFAVAETSAPERGGAIVFNTIDEDFLVVYEITLSGNDIDVMAQRVAGTSGGGDGGGELRGSSISVSATAGVEQSPDVAFLPSTQSFLVVYERDEDIWGQRIARKGLGDEGGELLGPAFPVAATFFPSELHPVVAASTLQSYFLVTFDYAFAGDDYDVRGQRVKGAPDHADQLLGDVFEIANSANTEHLPALTYSPKAQAFLTVWQTQIGTNEDIHAAWLDERIQSGNPLIGQPFAIADDPLAVEMTPAVDLDQTRRSDVVVTLSYAPDPDQQPRLGVIWIRHDPLAERHISRSLYLFPQRPYGYVNSKIALCHAKPGMLLGYSARLGFGDGAFHDAYVIATSPHAVALPLIQRR